jgi:HK97 gp10 family phage protein
MKVTATIINLNEFESQLNKLSNAARGDALSRAAMAGGQAIEAFAKINVEKTFSSKSTGGAGLGGSIHTELTKSGERSAEVSVGPSVVYGRIQEFGGIVKPVTAKMLSWVDDGVRIFANLVHLPPRPYLRPAVDEHIEEITQAVGASLQRDIEKALQ